MDEKQQALSDAEQVVLARRKRLFEEMIETEAWKELVSIAFAQRDNHRATLMVAPGLLSNVDGLTHVLTSEYRKGAVFGIETLVETPARIIATAKEIIRTETTERNPQLNPNRKENTDANEQRTAGRKPNADEFDTDLGPDTVVTDLGDPSERR